MPRLSMSALETERQARMRRGAATLGALLLAVAAPLCLAQGLAAFSRACVATGGATGDAVEATSPANATGSSTATESALLLAAAHLIIPVAGVERASLHDSFNETRGAHRHEALDIAAPLRTPVIAAGAGRVVKLFNSVPGGLTVYQFDPGETFAYYYAHLDAYAPGLSVGTQLQRGDLLGYVGDTGNAPPAAPHLHFAIFRLGPEKNWWQGEAVNPLPFLDNAHR